MLMRVTRDELKQDVEGVVDNVDDENVKDVDDKMLQMLKMLIIKILKMLMNCSVLHDSSRIL